MSWRNIMTTLNLNEYNRYVKFVNEQVNSNNPQETSLRGFILSLPFTVVKKEDNGAFEREVYKLDIGSHYIEYHYTWDAQDYEDDHSIFVNKSKKFAYGAEKTTKGSIKHLYEDALRFIAFITPYLNVSQETVMSNLNLTNTSFGKKDIKANLLALHINEQEVELALKTINKNMVGRKEVLTILLHTCISHYSDDTGLEYTVDQLLADVEKRVGKTFTCEVLNTVLKDIWGNVAPTLHQYPKGHALIKIILIELNKQFTGKNTVGIAQVREAIQLAALEAYSALASK